MIGRLWMGRLIIVMFEFDFIVFMQLFIGLSNYQELIIQPFHVRNMNGNINHRIDSNQRYSYKLPVLITQPMTRTNSKLPPLHDPPSPQALTIKSKRQPFMTTAQKLPMDQQAQTQQEIKYFPIDEYRNMLKGEKIYLEMYFKNKLFNSGYEPYIEAMGGEISKRLSINTTVVLTNQMTQDKYNRLKARVQKICGEQTKILSILWIQEIYRQKKKVDKNSYLFDQKTDITDAHDNLDDEQIEPMPDYFFRQVIQQDLGQMYEQGKEIYKGAFLLLDNRKTKQKEIMDNDFGFGLFMCRSKNVFDNEEQEQEYRKRKKQKTLPSFYTAKKQKPRQSTGQYGFLQKKQGDKRRKPSTSRLSLKPSLADKQSSLNNTSTIFRKQQSQISEQSAQDTKTQETKSPQESDSQFLQRIKNQNMKGTEPMKESINTILHKYLSKSEKQKEKEGQGGVNNGEVESRIREVEARSQQKVQGNRVTQWGNQTMEIETDNRLDAHHQYESNNNGQFSKYDTTFNQNNQSQSQNLNLQNKPSKAAKESPKTSPHTLTSSKKLQLQSKKSQIMKDLQTQIQQFFNSLMSTDPKTYSLIVGSKQVTKMITQANRRIEEKLLPENQIFFKIIDYKELDLVVGRNPLIRWFVDFDLFYDQVNSIGNKRKRIAELLRLDNEDDADVYFQVLMTLRDFSFGTDKKLYCIADPNNPEDTLLAALSLIGCNPIVSWFAIKEVFDRILMKQAREEKVDSNSGKSSMTRVPQSSFQNLSTKEMIEEKIFPAFQIKPKLCDSRIKGKRVISMITDKDKMSQIQFITRKLGGQFIPSLQYMKGSKQAHIIISTKPVISHKKDIWQPDFKSFVNALIDLQDQPGFRKR